MRMSDRGLIELSHNDYTVGWVCALPKEQTPAIAMLDERHGDLPQLPRDNNAYTLGSIGKHNVVIACLPKGTTGNNASAAVATQMVSAFPSIKIGLMVGIGGGVPPKVRLGDIVVSTPVGQFPGVIQWDYGKVKPDGFERTGALNNPPSALRTALGKLETEHEMKGSKIPQYLEDMAKRWPRLAPKYLKSNDLEDILFKSTYEHVNESPQPGIGNVTIREEWEEDDQDEEACRFCDRNQTIQRKPREMKVHYGLIASGNMVIKDASFREKLKTELAADILCIEMEAAGLMNEFPCLVIRGICDYADSHKNKVWQEHAAAVAASFAKEMLDYIQPSALAQEHAVKEILEQVRAEISLTAERVKRVDSKLNKAEDIGILSWLAPLDLASRHAEYVKKQQPGTSQWLLKSQSYQDWAVSKGKTLFCYGMPGAGKTIATAVIVEDLFSRFQHNPKIAITYIYCDHSKQADQTAETILSGILNQLCQHRASLPDSVRDLYKTCGNRKRPSLEQIWGVLEAVIFTFSRVFILIDALDECQNSDDDRNYIISNVVKLQNIDLVNLYTTSRAIPEITKLFVESQLLEVRAQKEDIEQYLEGQMSQLPKFVGQDLELREEIKANISKTVGGMFLLARLHLNSLKGLKSPKAVRLILQKLTMGSSTYDEEYEKVMKRIQSQLPAQVELAMRVLSWVVHAKALLNGDELQHALAVEPGETALDEENLPQIDDVISVCEGLLERQDLDKIGFVHFTVQEYFHRTKDQWFPAVQEDITQTCVTYLMFDKLKGLRRLPLQTRLDIELSHPLYHYACCYWSYHARNTTRILPEVIEFLKNKHNALANMLGEFSFGFKWEFSFDPAWGDDGGITGLHLAAFYGLEREMKQLLADGLSANARDVKGLTPLSYAAASGRENCVKLLLEGGTGGVNDEDLKQRTAMVFAADGGYASIVQLLLDAGADAGIGVFKDWNCLHVAAYQKHQAVIKVLLQNRAVHIEARGRDGYTALLVAAEFGNEETVLLLLSSGANPKVANNKGTTALATAVAKHMIEAVEILLNHGADVNSTDQAGNTPLLCALQLPDLALTEILLAEINLDPNRAGRLCRTPLFHAIEPKKPRKLQLLLADKRVDPEARDSFGITPLMLAVIMQAKSAVIRLLALGVSELDSCDIMGRSAWWWAQRHGKVFLQKLLLDKAKSQNIRLRSRECHTVQANRLRQGTICCVCTLELFDGVDNFETKCEQCLSTFWICAECAVIDFTQIKCFHAEDAGGQFYSFQPLKRMLPLPE